MLVRARWASQGIRLEIPCAPGVEHPVLFFRDMCQRITIERKPSALRCKPFIGNFSAKGSSLTILFCLCAVKGVAPPPDGSQRIVPSEFIRENKDLLESAGVKGANVWHQNQLDSYGYWLTFDRHLSLRRLRQEAGFSERNRPEEGWWNAFELFRKAGMIP